MSRIQQVLLPPTNPLEKPTPRDWSQAELRLGKLPDDYVHFVDIYGTGSIDNFMWVLSPSSLNPNLNLFDRGSAILADMQYMKEIGEQFEPDIPIEELMPCGVTDNGDYIFWWKKGNPNTWTIALNESRSPIIECFAGSLSEWLVDVLTRRIRSSVLPRSFPTATPGFQARTS